jgi:hypothetical protein
MNRRCYLSAVPALAVAAVVFASAEANAKVPEDASDPAIVVPRDPGVPSNEIPIQASTSVDTGGEVLRTGAAALGGAGVAFAGTWLYRRRQAHLA